MTSKEVIEALTSPYKHIDCKTYRTMIDTIKKDLEDFEWLKSKLNLVFLDSLSTSEDKERLLEIMGIKISYNEMK